MQITAATTYRYVHQHAPVSPSGACFVKKNNQSSVPRSCRWQELQGGYSYGRTTREAFTVDSDDALLRYAWFVGEMDYGVAFDAAQSYSRAESVRKEYMRALLETCDGCWTDRLGGRIVEGRRCR